jgi:hypothetical protein
MNSYKILVSSVIQLLIQITGDGMLVYNGARSKKMKPRILGQMNFEAASSRAQNNQALLKNFDWKQSFEEWWSKLLV